MRRFLIVALIPLATACGTTPTAVQPVAPGQPAPAVQQAPAAQAPAAQAPAAAKAEQPKKSWPQTTIPPLEQTGGIAIGQPLPIGWRMAAIQVTNTTDQVRSFTVRLKLRTGAKDNEMSASVSDLRPKQTHFMALNTYTIQNEVPDSATIEVTGMKEAATTPKAEANARIKLGEPVFTPGQAKATVEVANTDEKEHSFTVRAGFLNGDQLVGFAEKQISTLAAGQSTTATLIAVSETPAFDRVQVTMVGMTR